MRKLLNTLYVTTPEAYLSKDGLNIVVSVNQEEVFRIPAINIESIVTFGYMGASPGVMKLCSDSSISLTFLSPHGRFISRVQGATKGNVLLRKKQYQLSDNESWSLHISQLIIGAKIQNYRNILKRYIKKHTWYGCVLGISTVLSHRQEIYLRLSFHSAFGIFCSSSGGSCPLCRAGSLGAGRYSI